MAEHHGITITTKRVAFWSDDPPIECKVSLASVTGSAALVDMLASLFNGRTAATITVNGNALPVTEARAIFKQLVERERYEVRFTPPSASHLTAGEPSAQPGGRYVRA